MIHILTNFWPLPHSNSKNDFMDGPTYIQIPNHEILTDLRMYARGVLYNSVIFSPPQNARQVMKRTMVQITVYILGRSKLSASILYFAEPVKTSLWAIWAEQHAQYTWFLPQPSHEGNVPLNKSRDFSRDGYWLDKIIYKTEMKF